MTLTYVRKYTSNDFTSYEQSYNGKTGGATVMSIQEIGWSAPSGTVFSAWSVAENGSGPFYQPGDECSAGYLYAIWEDEPTHAVTISYQNSTIATMDETGVKTLLTGSTFCEDDIVISYTAPSGPSGTKNISISSNGTTTEDVTNYATASITVAVPQPSGSMTTVASGTYTGTGGYPSSAGTGIFVGTSMPKTDFWFKFCASSDSEFAYNTDYKHAYGLFAVFSEFGHYDLSTVGDSKQMISDITFDINNSGTVTATNAGVHIGFLNCVRNASATTTATANNLRIDRRSNGFYVRPYNSNSAYKYVSGMTYNWELVYFGSNPSTDIVGVS